VAIAHVERREASRTWRSSVRSRRTFTPPLANHLNNQIHESVSSPRPGSRSLQTPYRIVRATAPQSAHFPYQPAPTPGTTRPHLLLDFAHVFDTRFGGLLSPPPVSAPVYSPEAERVCFSYPHRTACLGDSLGCCLCYRVVARKQPLDGWGWFIACGGRLPILYISVVIGVDEWQLHHVPY
jgi:hypothetical protein